MTMEALPQDLADFLVTKNFDPEYFDEQGQPAEAGDAKTMKFDYIAGTGKNYGTAVIVVADDELNLFYGDNLGRGMDPEDKDEWFSFLEELSNKAASHSATWSPRDINQLKHTLAGIAAIKEGLFEGYYGNRRVSYMGEQTQARLVINHNRVLGEEDKRYRYVESLFIETADQERFRLPFKSLAAGRAMLEHVRQGGRPYDIRGNHITEVVSEMAVLSRFNRAQHRRVFEGVTQELVESAKQYYQNLQETMKQLGSPRGYQAYFESWAPDQVGEAEALVENLRDLFVEQTLDARIEAALPTLAKIQQQGNNMKEAEIFESWINNLSEGTWALPETPEQMEKLNQLMSAELIVGPDATNATELLYDIVGDDELFDILNDLADRSEGRANIWDDSDVQRRLAELGVQTPQSTQAEPADVAQDTAPAVKEGTGQPLSVQQLASVSDAALDAAYGYGRSTPGNTFGWQANLKSAAYAKQMIDQGVTDIEAISDAIHKGWNTTAQAFVQDPEQFDDTAKLAAAGKLEAKLQQRAQLMKQNYAQLPEEEKEKDRVVARALLQAIKGPQQQGVAEDFSAPPQDTTGHGDHIRQTSGGNRNVYRLSQLLRDPSVESYLKIEVPHVSTPNNELIQGIKSKKWEGVDGGRSSIDGPGGWFLTAKNPMYFKEFLQALSQSVSGDKQIRVGIDPYVKNARAQQGMAEGDNRSTFVENRELAEMLKYAGVPVKESVLKDSTGSTLEHIKDTFRRDVKDFTQSGDMSKHLYHALHDYYFDDMPYGAKTGDDIDPHEWVADRFAQDIGIDEGVLGTIGGAALGSMLGGPIGAAAGAVGGQELTKGGSGLIEGSCNMTMEGSYCPEHGLAECGGMYEDGGAVGMPYSMGEDNDILSMHNKMKEGTVGQLAGGTLGALGGATVGTALGGPIGGAIGTAFGGTAGQMGGDKLGDKISAVVGEESTTAAVVKGAAKAATQGLGDVVGGGGKDILKNLPATESDDPINSNSAMTGSYYEGKETRTQEGDALLARIKSLALLR
jgi:hypothetical protein